jgi:hypothetical protein
LIELSCRDLFPRYFGPDNIWIVHRRARLLVKGMYGELGKKYGCVVERLRDGERLVRARDNVRTFAIIGLELLTGERLTGSHGINLRSRCELLLKVPSELRGVFERALDHDPQSRPTLVDFAAALDAFTTVMESST